MPEGTSSTPSRLSDVVVRVAGADDTAAIAMLRALWSAGAPPDVEFERRMAAWLATEGERRTTWLATLDALPAGMASMFEYRRMPHPSRGDSRWGYVSNMFVREDLRNRGIGPRLLSSIIAAAEDRRYARLVLSPSDRSIAFFVVPDGAAGSDRMLVRSTRLVEIV